MASRESDIQELRTQLQASRWQMHDNLQRLEDQLNVPRRIKSEVTEHPVKWAAIALGAGIVVAKVVPILMRASGKKWVTQMLAPALRLAFVSAIPALMRAKSLNHFTHTDPN